MSSFSDYRIIKQTAQTFLLTSVERSDAVVVQLYSPSWNNNNNEITKTFYRIKEILQVQQARALAFHYVVLVCSMFKEDIITPYP
jgi:hypothetical protein